MANRPLSIGTVPNYADYMRVTPVWIQCLWSFEPRKCRGVKGQFLVFGFLFAYNQRIKIFWTINRTGIDFNHDLTWLWPWNRRNKGVNGRWMDWTVGSFENLASWRSFWRGYFEDMVDRGPEVEEPC